MAIRNLRLDQLIRFHRRASGLSQIELGWRAGVSRTVVQRLERGDVMASWQNVLNILGVLRLELRFDGPLMADFERAGVGALEAHFHALVRERAGVFLANQPGFALPALSASASPGVKLWLAVPGLAGGFQYWFERAGPDEDLKLVVESWNRDQPGSEARHEITAEGCRFVGRIINGVDFSTKSPPRVAE